LTSRTLNFLFAGQQAQGRELAPSFLFTAAPQHTVARRQKPMERLADCLIKIFTVNFRTKHDTHRTQQKGGFPGISFRMWGKHK
jgi:hypothetical protein